MHPGNTLKSPPGAYIAVGFNQYANKDKIAVLCDDMTYREKKPSSLLSRELVLIGRLGLRLLSRYFPPY